MRTRTLVVLAAVFALAAIATVTIGSNLTPRSHPGTVAGPVTAPPVSPAASVNPDASDPEDDPHAPPETQEAIWEPVVDSFGRNFTNTSGGAQEWRQRLVGPSAAPYVTTEVADQLKTVDTRNVPEGHYDTHELLKSSAYEIAVKIDYREGWAMVLYLITDGTRWQIYAYDRWEE